MLLYAYLAEIALGFQTIYNLYNSLVKEFKVFFMVTKEIKCTEDIMLSLEQSYIDV
ncbi:MAG: hypothetical protein ACI9UT_003223 [Flavobacteriales bacterium]|jgi:hypothetical protein